MIKQLVKIEESSSLAKDMNSRAVINTDRDAYLAALERKRKNQIIKQLEERVSFLEDKIKHLEDRINKIII